MINALQFNNSSIYLHKIRPLNQEQNNALRPSINLASNDTVFLFYKPLAFKGAGADLFARMKSNDTDISTITDIQSLNHQGKKEFVSKYCEETGFPDLPKITQNMLTHAKNTINEASKQADLPVLWSGYHSHCSVAHGLALPGSDIDALCMLVDGDQQKINQFKGEIWNKFNPLLVSVRKDFEFPDVYSIDQVHQWTKVIDRLAKENGLDKKALQYKENLKETYDYDKALEFNIDITPLIEGQDTEELKQQAPALSEMLSWGEKPKHITHSISSLLESMRSGKTLIPESLTEEQKNKLGEIKQSYLYKYGNICVQEADYDIKPKLLERKNLNRTNFEQMPVDKQVSLIQRMIYQSYPKRETDKIPNNFGREFEPMFNNGEGIDSKRNHAFQQCV